MIRIFLKLARIHLTLYLIYACIRAHSFLLGGTRILYHIQLNRYLCYDVSLSLQKGDKIGSH